MIVTDHADLKNKISFSSQCHQFISGSILFSSHA